MAVHVVQAGDHMWSISNRYGVSIKTIVELNGIANASSIVPGLALYIPDNNLPSRYYKIKSGDLLWKLAQQFNTNVSAILAANPGINPNQLYIGQILTIPSSKKLELATLGFLVPTAGETVLSLLNSLARQLTYIAIVAYSMTKEGWAYNTIEDRSIVARSKQLNITPLLMIQNFSGGDFQADLIGGVLENPTYRRNLVLSIVNLTKQRGFAGVSIDFEFIPPARRQDFTAFLTDLKNQLGPLILHVNLHAKTADLPTNRIVGAHDYAAIGKLADIVAVMTMDYGYPGGPPDPVAPINWMEQVIQYTISLISPRKLQIAMPLYGYDKVASTNATHSLSILAAQNQAISTGAVIQFNNTSKAPWYRHWHGVEEHVVWFEDIRSYIEKYKLIDLYQLIGTTFWQISLPAPQNWAYLGKNSTVIKG